MRDLLPLEVATTDPYVTLANILLSFLRKPLGRRDLRRRATRRLSSVEGYLAAVFRRIYGIRCDRDERLRRSPDAETVAASVRFACRRA